METVDRLKMPAEALLKDWAKGQLKTCDMLYTQGVKPALLTYCTKNSLLKNTRGLYYRPDDTPTWREVVKLLQQIADPLSTLNLGAFSALELHGYRLPAALSKPDLFLFSSGKNKLLRPPKWATQFCSQNIVFSIADFLKNAPENSLSTVMVNGIPLIAASPERAFLEILYWVPKLLTIEQAAEIRSCLRNVVDGDTMKDFLSRLSPICAIKKAFDSLPMTEAPAAPIKRRLRVDVPSDAPPPLAPPPSPVNAPVAARKLPGDDVPTRKLPSRDMLPRKLVNNATPPQLSPRTFSKSGNKTEITNIHKSTKKIPEEILKRWLPGSIHSIEALQEKNITSNEILTWHHKGYLTKLQSETYMLASAKLTLEEIYLFLRHDRKMPVYIGNITAMKMQGFAQNHKDVNSIYFYMPSQKYLPTRLLSDLSSLIGMEIQLIGRNIFSEKMNHTIYPIQHNNQIIYLSSPERALFEALSGLPEIPGMQAAQKFISEFTFSTPGAFQVLLEDCTDSLAKGVLLYYAHQAGLPWYASLDRSQIMLKGARQLWLTGKDGTETVFQPKAAQKIGKLPLVWTPKRGFNDFGQLHFMRYAENNPVHIGGVSALALHGFTAKRIARKIDVFYPKHVSNTNENFYFLPDVVDALPSGALLTLKKDEIPIPVSCPELALLEAVYQFLEAYVEDNPIGLAVRLRQDVLNTFLAQCTPNFKTEFQQLLEEEASSDEAAAMDQTEAIPVYKDPKGKIAAAHAI